ncbi:hypothetical protein EVAR_24169_1 [Eumeta japonica]|uniref:Uncharacterized protein n=1 Tax=Eumeta variegata TaxID=151549 RepID=A0A4C1W387_EUMVA|nr:hypothetical protein EVAR_24169_1 [Eumeta japonica]
MNDLPIAALALRPIPQLRPWRDSRAPATTRRPPNWKVSHVKPLDKCFDINPPRPGARARTRARPVRFSINVKRLLRLQPLPRAEGR